MQLHVLLIASVLAACRPPAPAAPAPPAASRDLSTEWIAAVHAKDAKAIEAMLALPFTLYYDDGYSDPFHAPDCVFVRVLRQITTAAERTRVASCIATTVSLATVAPAFDPIGIATAHHVKTIVPPDVHGDISARASTHVFTRVPSYASGSYDVTLANPRQGTKADLVVLWTIHG